MRASDPAVAKPSSPRTTTARWGFPSGDGGGWSSGDRGHPGGAPCGTARPIARYAGDCFPQDARPDQFLFPNPHRRPTLRVGDAASAGDTKWCLSGSAKASPGRQPRGGDGVVPSVRSLAEPPASPHQDFINSESALNPKVAAGVWGSVSPYSNAQHDGPRRAVILGSRSVRRDTRSSGGDTPLLDIYSDTEAQEYRLFRQRLQPMQTNWQRRCSCKPSVRTTRTLVRARAAVNRAGETPAACAALALP